MRIPDFVKSELLYIKENANLTEREEILLDLRNKEIPLEECAERMNCSVSTVYRINKRMKRKIYKVIGMGGVNRSSIFKFDRFLKAS